MNAGNKTQHTKHAPSTKTVCDYLNGWIRKKKEEKMVKYTGEPRDIAGNTEEDF